MRNHFFGHNSGKPEPTGTKFYKETSTEFPRSPANVWRPPPNECKWRRKPHLNANFFVTKITHRFTHFPAADFREIWAQNANRCRHEFIWNKIVKYLMKNEIINRFVSSRQIQTDRPPTQASIYFVHVRWDVGAYWLSTSRWSLQARWLLSCSATVIPPERTATPSVMSSPAASLAYSEFWFGGHHLDRRVPPRFGKLSKSVTYLRLWLVDLGLRSSAPEGGSHFESGGRLGISSDNGILSGLPTALCKPSFTRTWLRYVRLFAIENPPVVCLSSATFVRPTQDVETFGNISSPFCMITDWLIDWLIFVYY